MRLLNKHIIMAVLVVLLDLVWMLTVTPLVIKLSTALPLFYHGTAGAKQGAAIISEYFASFGAFFGFLTVDYATPITLACVAAMLVVDIVVIVRAVKPRGASNPILDSMPARAKSSVHGDARFLTKSREIAADPDFTLVDDADLASQNPGGLYLGRFGSKNVLVTGDWHMIVNAPSGVGKTRMIVLQTICCLAEAGECFLCTDVKGEISAYAYGFLKEKCGYNVFILDFEKFSKFNWFNPAYRAIKTYSLINNYPVKGPDGNPIVKDDGEPVTMSLFRQIDKSLASLKKAGNLSHDAIEASGVREMTDALNSLLSSAGHDVDQLADTIYASGMTPSQIEHDNGFYRNGAKNVIRMVLHFVLSSPHCPDSQKTFRTCSNVLSIFGGAIPVNPKKQGGSQFIPLFEEIRKLPLKHPAHEAMEKLAEENRYTAEFISEAASKLGQFKDVALSQMMEGSDFEVPQLVADAKPSATFLVLPGEITATEKALGSLYIETIYKHLVEYAASEHGNRLPRRYNMICEELGQIDSIDNLASRMSLCRATGIRWMLILQDFSQLDDKYGREARDIILSNCKYHVILEVGDQRTAEFYSDSFGTYTATEENHSSSKSPNSLLHNTVSDSTRLVEVPLMSLDNLERWKASYGALVWRRGGMPCIIPAPQIHLTPFNEMLGLGDEARNREIVADFRRRGVEHERQQAAQDWTPELNSEAKATRFYANDERKALREARFQQLRKTAAGRQNAGKEDSEGGNAEDSGRKEAGKDIRKKPGKPNNCR